jgi:hypothetical protein
LGIADRIRVPSPAASTIVRLVLPVIRILDLGGGDAPPPS